MEEPTENVSSAVNTEIDIMDILEAPRAPDKSTKPRKKRARTFPLEYWKVEPPWQQIEEEIDDAILLTWKDQDRVANNIIQMALDKKLEKKEMAETSKIDSKEPEEVKIQEPKVKKLKIPKENPNETKQAKLDKLKACHERITEKRKTKKLQGQEKRKEDLLKKYGSIELRKLKI